MEKQVRKQQAWNLTGMRAAGYIDGLAGKNPAYTPEQSDEYTIGWMNGATKRNEDFVAAANREAGAW